MTWTPKVGEPGWYPTIDSMSADAIVELAQQASVSLDEFVERYTRMFTLPKEQQDHLDFLLELELKIRGLK